MPIGLNVNSSGGVPAIKSGNTLKDVVDATLPSSHPNTYSASEIQPSVDSSLRYWGEYDERAREAAEAQRVWSAEQAQKQMDFQERMSNTAYQRVVEDLKAAGLNPALAYQQGGATTSSGAMASSATAEVYTRNDMLDYLIESNKVSVQAFSAVLKLLDFF